WHPSELLPFLAGDGRSFNGIYRGNPPSLTRRPAVVDNASPEEVHGDLLYLLAVAVAPIIINNGLGDSTGDDWPRVRCLGRPRYSLVRKLPDGRSSRNPA